MFNEKKRLVKELNAESEDRLSISALKCAREYQCKQELVRQLHVSMALILFAYLNNIDLHYSFYNILKKSYPTILLKCE